MKIMRIKLNYFVCIIMTFFVGHVLNLCRMQQLCDVTQPDCRPEPANFTQPQILLGPNIICPEYYNKTACCNNGQNIVLKNNFDSLDSVFGSKYGGCDICSVNLKRFWCHFTCSPDQDKFMNDLRFQDFEIEKVNYTLLMIETNVNSRMNCELFNSCKKTKYASQVVAMSNAIGFMSFQGTESYRKAPIFIAMNFTKEVGLDFEIDTCDTKPVDGKVRGYYVEDTCKCNSCEKSCQYDIKTSFAILEGFSIFTVGIFYLFVFIFTLIISLCKSYYKDKNPEDHSRSSSLNTEYAVDNKDNNSRSVINITRNNINNNQLNNTN